MKIRWCWSSYFVLWLDCCDNKKTDYEKVLRKKFSELPEAEQQPFLK